jgi:hypothetical protein
MENNASDKNEALSRKHRPPRPPYSPRATGWSPQESCLWQSISTVTATLERPKRREVL